MLTVKQSIVFFVAVSVLTEQVSGHPIIGLALAKAHVIPKIALLNLGTAAATAGLVAPLIVKKKILVTKGVLGALQTKAKIGGLLIGAKKAALVKTAIIAKPLLIKGAIIAGKVHLFNHLKKKVLVTPYKHTYGHTYGKSTGYVAKSTGYGSHVTGVRSTAGSLPSFPSLLPPIVPAVTFPEINVPVRLSVGSSANNVMNQNINSDDSGFSQSLDQTNTGSRSSKQ